LGFGRSGLVYATRYEADIGAWDKWGQMAKLYGVRSEILNAQQAKAMTPGRTTTWLAGVSAPADGPAEPNLAAPGMV
ncbi:D-amino-acid oxidase, partial [Pantoea allii]